MKWIKNRLINGCENERWECWRNENGWEKEKEINSENGEEMDWKIIIKIITLN